MSAHVLTLLGGLAAASGRRAWVAGGWVRDRLLDRTPADLDIVIEGDAAPVVDRIAAEIGQQPARIVKNRSVVWRFAFAGWPVDLSACPVNGIREELARRDLAINAMACPLTPAGPDLDSVTDPFGGRADLGARRVRFTSESALLDDPLRALRAIRFAVTIDRFSLDPAAAGLIRRHAASVESLPKERIAGECDLVFATCRSGEALALMEDAGLLARLFDWTTPLRGVVQNRWHRHDVFDHTLRTVSECDPRAQRSLPGSPPGGLGVEDTVTLKWAALLHDAGKPTTARPDGRGGNTFHGHEKRSAAIARRVVRTMRLPGSRGKRIVGLVESHLRLPLLAAASEATERAVRRLVHHVKQDTPLLCVLALADCAASGGVRLSERLLALEGLVARVMAVVAGEGAQVMSPSPLLSGHEVMRRLGCGPGPRVGAVLRWLVRLQVEGRIATREEAIELIDSLPPSGPPPEED